MQVRRVFYHSASSLVNLTWWVMYCLWRVFTHRTVTYFPCKCCVSIIWSPSPDFKIAQTCCFFCIPHSATNRTQAHFSQTHDLCPSWSEIDVRLSRPCSSFAVPFTEGCARKINFTYPISADEHPKPISWLWWFPTRQDRPNFTISIHFFSLG